MNVILSNAVHEDFEYDFDDTYIMEVDWVKVYKRADCNWNGVVCNGPSNWNDWSTISQYTSQNLTFGNSTSGCNFSLPTDQQLSIVAGTEIEIKGEFGVEAGSFMRAEIYPCDWNWNTRVVDNSPIVTPKLDENSKELVKFATPRKKEIAVKTEKFVVSPNPSNGVFKVRNVANEYIVKIQLYDSFMNLVPVEINQQENEYTVKVLGSAGVYYLEITSESGERQFEKMVLTN